MATTLVATNTTNNSIQFRITNTDATALTAITQAQLIAACAAGQLKQFLTGLSTTNFNALNNNPALEIIVVGISAAVTAAVSFASGSLTITPSSTAAAAPGFTVTLRFVPAYDR